MIFHVRFFRLSFGRFDSTDAFVKSGLYFYKNFNHGFGIVATSEQVKFKLIFGNPYFPFGGD